MPLAVGVKFCGGCTPAYDRVAVAGFLEKELEGIVRFSPHHQGDPDIILIIAGCRTACVDPSPFNGRQVFLITGAGDAERFINLIRTGVFKWTGRRCTRAE